MKTAIIHVRVTQEVKFQLSTYARLEGLTESDVIRRMIGKVLMDKQENNHVPLKALTEESYDRRKITITVPFFIADLAIERAMQKGMSLSRWIASLIQVHVCQPPVLTVTELKLLNESNRQIRAVGVNINQIAKAFNNFDVDIRKLKDFHVIENIIRENLAVIDKLIRAANRSWGVDHGPD